MSFRRCSTGRVIVAAALLSTACAGTPTMAASSGSDRDTIAVDARLGQRVLKHGERQRVFLRIGIRGIRGGDREARTPANIALVIDRSGSMTGSKIERARQAASMAINRLSETDIAAVVVFDDKIDTLVRATRVDEPGMFHARIERISVGGSTAIFAAVQEAAREIRRHKSPHRLNRIILMSDGKANVGPSRPHHFEELGRELGSQGISVTTIGLGDGYNEDLMSELANSSDGNHAFARSASDLTGIFNQEFDDVLSVTGQDVEIIIRTKAGVRPIRTWGRRGEVDGNVVRLRLNQVYGSAEYSLQLELDVPAGLELGERDLVDVEVNYTPAKGERRRIATSVTGHFSGSDEDVRKSLDPEVMAPILELEARERMRKAIELRDKGQVEAARSLLKQNATDFEAGHAKFTASKPGFAGAARLKQLQESNSAAAASIDDRAQWSASRKQMREDLSNRQGAKLKY